MPYSASARAEATRPRLSPAHALFECVATCGAFLSASYAVAEVLAILMYDQVAEWLDDGLERPRWACGTRRIVHHRGGRRRRGGHAAAPHSRGVRRDVDA